MPESSAAPRTMADMLNDFSIEIGTREPKVVTAAVNRLEPGTEVYLTWIPGEDPFRAVEASAGLSRGGLKPVPHIGARHLENEKQLSEILNRLTGEAGVDRILLIGGERDDPLGPYDSSLKVMQTGLIQKYGIRRVGVGGFPEGHPKISDKMLGEALVEKMNFARQSGLALHIVTQFCFEGQAILDWLRKIRALGVDMPVRIGLAGPASLTTLTRYALRCGVGNSIRALTHGPAFSKLLTERNPEPIVRDLAVANGAAAGLGIAALHFYSFGGFGKTVDWISAARNQ